MKTEVNEIEKKSNSLMISPSEKILPLNLQGPSSCLTAGVPQTCSTVLGSNSAGSGAAADRFLFKVEPVRLDGGRWGTRSRQTPYDFDASTYPTSPFYIPLRTRTHFPTSTFVSTSFIVSSFVQSLKSICSWMIPVLQQTIPGVILRR